MIEYRPKSLSPEALEAWDVAEANTEASMQRVKELTATTRMTKDKPKLTSIKMAGPVNPETRLVSAARVTHSPSDWRLARRNGELILQCGSIWNQGNDFGTEWKDLPTVDLDELELIPQ